MLNVSRLQMNLRALHRTSAILIAAFACLHVANHLASLAGIPSHIAFMEAARKLYRQPAVEFPLLLSVAFQLAVACGSSSTGGNKGTVRLRGCRQSQEPCLRSSCLCMLEQ